MTPEAVQAAAGQRAYVGAMITGLTLLLLLAAQLVLAFLVRYRWKPRSLPTWLEAHRLLGLLLIAIVWLHPLSYVLAVFRRAGTKAPGAILHSLTDGSYYGSSLVLGLVATILVTTLAVWQLRAGRPHWVHAWIRLAVVLGLWHALRIGSHVRDGAGGLLLRIALGLIVAEGVLRVLRVLRAGWRQWGAGGRRGHGAAAGEPVLPKGNMVPGARR